MVTKDELEARFSDLETRLVAHITREVGLVARTASQNTSRLATADTSLQALG